MVLESVLVTYKPMAVSFQCMTKFTTNKKKKRKKRKKNIFIDSLKNNNKPIMQQHKYHSCY